MKGGDDMRKKRELMIYRLLRVRTVRSAMMTFQCHFVMVKSSLTIGIIVVPRN